ncbi:TadE/TadG family type IV pilus assembly protein [Methylobacterium segetis]|uniref:TadE/TadG family type IV pilus assembly protein n=1 Tax=Methylobacterium segetis TaxID=2488750 RepID=UPI001051CAA3|nr:TadE/TadG family type IV pilus assembly protein [Methylobacterium segetis]
MSVHRARAARPAFPCASFARAERGGTAVEFALLLPVMLGVYLGLAELGRGIQAKRGLAQYARTIADLTGRGTPPDMTPIFEAANLVARPYDSAAIDARISAIGVYKTGNTYRAVVCSSAGNRGSNKRSVKSDIQAEARHGSTFPETFKEKTTSVNAALYNRYILAEVTGTFTPMLGSRLFQFTGVQLSSTLQETIAWPQRTDEEIVLPSGDPCPTKAPT